MRVTYRHYSNARGVVSKIVSFRKNHTDLCSLINNEDLRTDKVLAITQEPLTGFNTEVYKQIVNDKIILPHTLID